MAQKYLIRLDDACPTMDKAKWKRMEDILDRCGVKPMVGVIPHNEDPMQQIDPADDGFWNKVREWNKKGWAIALHGYNHRYETEDGLNGLNPLWKRSEFSGLPLNAQKEKVREGIALLREQDINPRYFFAPSHTFDDNTLIALHDESDIRIISDTIATHPYVYKGFVFIPQFCGQCREIKLKGVFTFCLHPSTMKEESFENTNKFLQLHKKEFTSFDAIDVCNKKAKCFFDKALSFSYFFFRRLRGIS